MPRLLLTEDAILAALRERRDARLALDRVGRGSGFVAASRRFQAATDAVRVFQSRAPKRTARVAAAYLAGGITVRRSDLPFTRI